MRYAASSEQKRLLYDISILDFVLTDLTLFLDTHPNDKKAMDMFARYSHILGQAKNEYGSKYGPLTVDDADPRKEWLWATQPLPWKGGC